MSRGFVLLKSEAKPQLAFRVGLVLGKDRDLKKKSSWNIDECKFDIKQMYRGFCMMIYLKVGFTYIQQVVIVCDKHL